MLSFSALTVLLSCIGGSKPADHVPLTLIPSGALRKVGTFLPMPLTLTTDKPSCAKKIPNLTKPKFGVITIQNREHAVIVDEQESEFKLYLDSNCNGDLTDEAPVDWKASKYKSSDGKDYTLFRGAANIDLVIDGVKNSVSFGVYQFDPLDPARKEKPDNFYYYSDYVGEGSITLEGKEFKCYLMDWHATGFIPDLEKDDKGEIINSGLQLAIDVNGNGSIEPRGERFGAFQLFNITGTSFGLTSLSATGFDFEKSKEKVKKVPLPPVAGDKIPNFTVKPISGSPFEFQEKYKKKLVLVYFWAITDEYSTKEIPGLVSAYEKYHSQGIEILGVNCDQPEAAKGLSKYISDHKMPWPEISEHRRIEEDVINHFVVRFLPAGFLIDGDTGKVLATIEKLRGEKLGPTIEKALAVKKSGK